MAQNSAAKIFTFVRRVGRAVDLHLEVAQVLFVGLGVDPGDWRERESVRETEWREREGEKER